MELKLELPKMVDAKPFKYKGRMIYEHPYKHSGNEDLRWLLWLMEVQQWLRKTYKVYVQPTLIEDTESISEQFDVIVASITEQKYIYDKSLGETYEQALAIGIYESLIYLKDRV